MASTVTSSQSNRAPLGCGGMGDSHHGCAADKSAATDAVMSIWTKISEECFQHLVESMPQRIEAVLKAKGVEPGTSNVYPIKWPVSVYIYIYIYLGVARYTGVTVWYVPQFRGHGSL